MEPSDEALVLACRRGDEAAWETLIRRYHRLVYTIPSRAGLDEDLSDEVFQGVFAKLVEHIDHLDQPWRLNAWLVTTARRETRRVSQNARSLGISINDDDAPIDVPDGEPLPDEVLLSLEEQHTVLLAVESLDVRCRTLLTLLFYQPEPPSYAEIATLLGTSEGSIGPTRLRCLQKLRQLLGKMGLVMIYLLMPMEMSLNIGRQLAGVATTMAS
jgi:RNA polymerase sigma factor (sigma-70 family)